MKLVFRAPYLSIQSLPETELPKLTLITGVNGSGKTHLLRAISLGYIATDVAPNHKMQTRFFDWATLVPNNTGEYQAAAVYNERDQIISWGIEERLACKEEILRWISANDLVSILPPNPSTIFRLEKRDIDKLLGSVDKAEKAWKKLEEIGKSAFQKMKRHARSNEPLLAKIVELEGQYGFGVLALDNRDFEEKPFGWGQVNVFQQSFAQLFLTYFEMKRLNMLRRLDEKEGRQPSVKSMSDEEFLEKYGEPPWDFVNRILKDARLDFEIDYPIEHSTTKFTPRLRKTTSGVELNFGELSSGERILMSFALCLYYSLDKRQDYQRPKLLLFDEIDAPLHPSMSRQLIDTIRKSLVEDMDVHVILTTHSPSTVAVAQDEFVYLMRPDEPGLHKVGKRQAIATLTSEIPTLSIDYEGRRQVFVESRYDAERYEKLYKFLSGYIPSERSLAFIAAGPNKKDAAYSGGCDRVKQVVDDLAAAGNDSVFGLVDWDKNNQKKGRVFVLAEGRRYAIENCLLDPMLVAALVVYTKREWGYLVGLADGLGYTDFQNLSIPEYQAIVDEVVLRVLGSNKEGEMPNTITARYLGGRIAQIPLEYLSMNGHVLEQKTKEAFPILNAYHNEGELLKKIIDPIIFDCNEIVPIEIVSAFQEILDVDVSINEIA